MKQSRAVIGVAAGAMAAVMTITPAAAQTQWELDHCAYSMKDPAPNGRLVVSGIVGHHPGLAAGKGHVIVTNSPLCGPLIDLYDDHVPRPFPYRQKCGGTTGDFYQAAMNVATLLYNNSRDSAAKHYVPLECWRDTSVTIQTPPNQTPPARDKISANAAAGTQTLTH